MTYLAPAGRCEQTQIVQRPSGPHATAAARGSIAPAWSRGWRIVNSSTTSHSANGSVSNGRLRPLERHVRIDVVVDDHVGAQCILEIDHRRQCLGLDDHHLRGIDRLCSRLGQHHGDGLADEPHDGLRHHRTDHRLVHHRQARWQHPHVGQVRPGQHGGDAWHRRSIGRVDRDQSTMRFDRSNEHRVERAVQFGKAQSVDEGSSADEQWAVLATVGVGNVGAHGANLSHTAAPCDLGEPGASSRAWPTRFAHPPPTPRTSATPRWDAPPGRSWRATRSRSRRRR